MNKVTIGLDTAKSVFHLVIKNAQGRMLRKKKLKRAQVLVFFANLPPATVIMEACGSSHYWCRGISRLGHEVKAIPPQYIVPYRKGNKNDYNDAEAIAEAAQRENMRFVPFKSQSQQDVQLVHRVRERLIGQRTALSNQIRGLLAEYGIVLPKGLAKLTKGLLYILEDADNELSIMTRHQFSDLLEELKDLQVRIKQVDSQIKTLVTNLPTCQRLLSMTRIGPLIATALYAGIGNGQAFKSGRHLSAWFSAQTT